MTRRGFLKTGAAAGAGLGMAGLSGLPAVAADDPAGAEPPRKRGETTMAGVPFEPHDVVRVGIIGLGMRGGGMVQRFLNTPAVRVTALSDINPSKVATAAARVRNAGQPDPAVYLGEDDFEKLAARDDVDFIYSATPWELHHPIGISGMKNGKHVGLELPLAMDLKGLWDLVITSERTRRHCFTFHNRSYGDEQLRLLRLVDDGRMGDLLYGAGGYVHDLRSLNFSNRHEPEGWRRRWHTRMNTNLYPVHGLAPIANAMKINRGDRFDRLMSVASPEAGYSLYREENMPPNHPSWEDDYICGDTNMCFIETVKGRFIQGDHNVSSPHPYSRANVLQGTRGKLIEVPTSSFANEWHVYLEPDHSDDEWRSFNDYPEYDHWLWADGIGTDADFLVVWRTMQCLRLGLVPDIDVYDSAVWSSPIPLCQESLKRGSRPVKVPDFTRGHWEKPRSGINSPRPEEETSSASSTSTKVGSAG
jgi:predicted dehydrogenase